MMCKGKKCIFGAVLPSTNCNYMVGSQKTDNSSSSGEIVIKGKGKGNQSNRTQNIKTHLINYMEGGRSTPLPKQT